MKPTAKLSDENGVKFCRITQETIEEIDAHLFEQTGESFDLQSIPGPVWDKLVNCRTAAAAAYFDETGDITSRKNARHTLRFAKDCGIICCELVQQGETRLSFNVDLCPV